MSARPSLASALFAAAALLYVVVVGVGAGCSSPSGGPSHPDATPDAALPDSGLPGCLNPCGATCCADGEVCADASAGQCCRPSCAGRQCGDDGCGGSCGSCDEGYACDEQRHACECVGESDVDFCRRLGQLCGSLTGTDLCGAERTVDCAACTPPQACDPISHTCTCERESDAAFCARLGMSCGEVSDVDTCLEPRTVSCGDCTGDALCIAGSCCAPETDAELCKRNRKACGRFAGLDNCGQTREVFDCGDCATPKTCQDDGRCATETSPFNDDCNGAEEIVFDAQGTATIHGTTNQAFDDASAPGCGGGDGGADVVYSFVLAEPKNVEITYDPGHLSTAMLSLRTTCDDPATQLACSAAEFRAPTLVRGPLAKGLYFLWLDNEGVASGNFTVYIALTDPPPPPGNDLCVAAYGLTFQGDTASTTGTTLGAVDDGTGSCAPMNGGDVVYQFHLDANAAVRAEVIGASGGGYTPAVWLLDGCGASAHEVACGGPFQGRAAASSLELWPGDYYVVVDGAEASRGDFMLQVVRSAPIGHDTCAHPKALVFPPGLRTAVEHSDTGAANDDAQSSCSSPAPDSGGDLVYSFAVPPGTPQTVVVDVVPTAGSALAPALSVRTSCDQAATEIGCSTNPVQGGLARLKLRSRPAGTYYLWVDGASKLANGPFDLTLSLSDPGLAPQNDLCVAATRLTLDSTTGRASVAGTTVDATNDTVGGCALTDGADVVYVFTLAAAGSVTATVTPDATTPGFRPAVYLRASCASSAADSACAAANAVDGPTAAVAGDLAAGDYYVVVDGLGSSEGAFTLELEAGPAVDNFTCLTARALVPDPVTGTVSLNGDTALGQNRTSASCAPAFPSGNDLVYTFTIPAGAAHQDVDIAVEPLPGSALVPTLSMRTVCERIGSELPYGCAAATAIAPVGLTMTNLAPGAYAVVVDAYGRTDDGPFRLTLQARDAPPAPSNDGCRSPDYIAIDRASGVGSAAGDTTYASNDGAPSCRGGTPNPTGPDVVFNFDLDRERDVEIQVTPTQGSRLIPVVSVRGDCAQASSEIACAVSGSSVLAGHIVLPRLAAGAYAIWVDSYSPAAAGPFTVWVSAAPPPPPPSNDTCAAGGARALMWDSSRGVFWATGSTAAARDDYAGSCATAARPLTGPDVVYSFHLAADQGLAATITRSFASGSYRPALYVRSVCASAAAADNLGCVSTAANQRSATLEIAWLAAGDYYVIVDGVAGSAGDFTVEVQPRAGVSNSSCLNPTALQFDATGRAHEVGDTSYATDDASAVGCPGPSGRDVVYLLDTTGMGRRLMTATIDFPSSAILAALTLRRGSCDSTAAADEVTCWRNGSLTSGEHGITTTLPEGVYYLWVDTTDPADAGPFALDVELAPAPTPPVNDSCLTAQSLVFTGNQATVTGTTEGATAKFTEECSGEFATGPEVVYKFTLSSERMVTAHVARDLSTRAYKPAVFLRSGCGSASTAADLRACGIVLWRASIGAPDARAARLAAGDYYVIVDGYENSSGAFTLTVTTDTPRDYPDSCASPQALSFDAAGHAAVADSVVWALDDDAPRGAACAGPSGNDLVYKVDTTALGARDLLANLVFELPDSQAVIYLRSTCDWTATELACTRSPTATAALGVPNLAPGVYYLWVETGEPTSPGNFALSVDVTAPPPASTNGTCSAAQPLSFDSLDRAHVSGATDASFDLTTGSCAMMNGPELVYSFEMPLAGDALVRLTRSVFSPSYEPAFYVRADCASTSATDEPGCTTALVSPVPGIAAQQLYRLAAGTTYYVFVDGTSGTAGRFDLDVARVTPQNNDTCASVRGLTLDASGRAFIRTSNEGAADDAVSSCSGAKTGPDIVFSFEVPAGTVKHVDITATPEPLSSFVPALSVRTACALRSSELSGGCVLGDELDPSAPTTLRLRSVPAGTYYLWVDGLRPGSRGPFLLQLEMFDPPANDTCAQPMTLAFTNNAARVTDQVIDRAVGDSVGTCGLMDGPDLVYQFTTRVAQKLTATVIPSPLLAPSMYLRRSCASTAASDELACETMVAPGSTIRTSVYSLPAGTYYLWVDSVSGADVGTFTLELELAPPIPPPANDTCVGAIALTRNQPESGDTTYANNDYTDLSSPACVTGLTGRGPDLVYSFTANSSSFIVTATQTGGWDLVLWVASSPCGMASTCTAFSYTGLGGPERITVTNATVGMTYFIFVDGAGKGAYGPFTISVH